MSDMIHVSNCPACDAFPVQYIAAKEGKGVTYRFVGGGEAMQSEIDKRDAEVVELKNQLAISQALNVRLCGEGAPAALWKEVAQVESKRGEFVAELTRKLAEQQAVIVTMQQSFFKLKDNFTVGSQAREDVIGMIIAIEDKEQLTALLAKERERCAVVCDEEESAYVGSYFAAEIRSLK